METGALEGNSDWLQDPRDKTFTPGTWGLVMLSQWRFRDPLLDLELFLASLAFVDVCGHGSIIW